MYPIPGEEVLAQLGYSLNCSRVGAAPDLPCWYDVLAPLAATAGFTVLSAVLLHSCVKDPH